MDADTVDSIINRLDNTLTERSTVLIFSSPCNPSGRVFSAAELQRIGGWASQHGLWVLSDEIYEHLNFTTDAAASYLQVKDCERNGVVVNGVAKAYSMTGWRVGWSIAPEGLAEGIGTLRSQISSNVSNVSQFAATAALSAGLRDVALARDELKQRRDLMVELLLNLTDVRFIVPQGGMYVFACFDAFTNRSLGGTTIISTVDLAALLLDRYGVATVPGEAFGCPGYLRLSFSLPERDIEDGVLRLRNGLGLAPAA